MNGWTDRRKDRRTTVKQYAPDLSILGHKNLQRAIARCLNETELWFLHTALLLSMVYLYVKYEFTSSFTLEVKPLTKIQS